MDAIMQGRIEWFNQFVMSLDIDKIPIGLFSGKMGICIYFYYQARLNKNKEYENFAELLINSIYTQIHTEMPIYIEDGLVGLCYGINYLIEKRFVKGNVNFILKEVDDKIYSFFCFNVLSEHTSSALIENLITIVELTMYFCIRLENNNLNANEQYLFKNVIIKAINKIENTTLTEEFTEPSLFSVKNYFLPIYLTLLCKIYKLNFYNYKVEKILDELSDKLKSTYPLQQSGRLLISAGMRNIEKVRSMDGWKEHILLLEQNTNFSSILKDEFRNKNVFPSDGITGFYFLSKNLLKFPNESCELLSKKIVLSDVWDIYLEDKTKLESRIGLVTGFCGVILTYQDILNNPQNGKNEPLDYLI